MYLGKKILVAVDCLIFGYDTVEQELKVLLFKRKVDPFSGRWSLIGDFVGEDEHVSQAAFRVLKQHTGMDDVFMEQLHAFGDLGRDPGARVISIVYWSLIKLDDLHVELAEGYGAKWFGPNELPEMIIDHADMIERGYQELKSKARNEPLGFELLPKEFTLPQLFRLYQSIYQQNLDDRNFRKKILSTGLLLQLDKKDKSTSKKGAFLYKFDTKKYQKLRQNGNKLEFLFPKS